jgi:hypothetical protein
LTFCKWISAAHEQHTKLFKQFAGGCANRSSRLLIFAINNRRRGVIGVKLAPGEGIEAAEKGQLFAATNKKDFGINGI